MQNFLLFKSESPQIPKICISLPKINTKRTNSFCSNSETNSSGLNLIKDFGLLELSNSYHSSSSLLLPIVPKSRINMSDFFGVRNSQKLLSLKKVLPLKGKIKKQQFIEKIKAESDLHKPCSSKRMDDNTKLRLELEKSRREELLLRKKNESKIRFY